MSIANGASPNNSNPAGSVPKSPQSSGIFGWIRQNPDPTAMSNNPVSTTARGRRDSSSLTADEALNISRANARPLDIPRTLQESDPHVAPSSPKDIPRSKPKYDKLGLIAAFSGGPGSF